MAFGAFVEAVIDTVVRVLFGGFVEGEEVGFVTLVGEVVAEVGGHLFGSATNPEHPGYDENLWLAVGLHSLNSTKVLCNWLHF